MERGFGTTCSACEGTGYINRDKKTCDCTEPCLCLWGTECSVCEGRGSIDDGKVHIGSTVHEIGCNCGFCRLGATKQESCSLCESEHDHEPWCLHYVDAE